MEIDVDVRAAIEAPKIDRVRPLSFPCTYPVRYTVTDGEEIVITYSGDWSDVLYRVSMVLQDKKYYDDVVNAQEAEIWFNGRQVLRLGRPYPEAYAEVRQK